MEASSELSRRSFTRYAPVTWGYRGSVFTGKRRLSAEILDESLAGVGVRVSSQANLTAGQIVNIENDRFSRRAKLVFLSPDESGGLRVGLQWTPDSEYEFA